MTFNSSPAVWWALSQWRLPLTPPDVMSMPNSGMTINTLVLTVDSFSCNCNSIDNIVSKDFQEHFSLSSSYCCDCINTSVISIQYLQFQFVQQYIQISTRINSSMYICTSAFVSLETHPIFNNQYWNKGSSVGTHECCLIHFYTSLNSKSFRLQESFLLCHQSSFSSWTIFCQIRHYCAD